MRKFTALAALSVLGMTTVAVAYTFAGGPTDSMTADVERDLQLAAAAQPQRANVVSAIEQGLNGAPSGQARGARMVVPTRKRAPTAAPSPQVMDAPVSTESAEVPTPVAAPVTSEPVAVASSTGESSADAAPPDLSYPTPAEAPASGTGIAVGNGNDGRGAGNTGESDRGTRRTSGVSGVVGTVLGAIIRGSSVGVDHCEPRRGRASIEDGGTVIGQIGTVLGTGRGAPVGSIPAGRMPTRGW